MNVTPEPKTARTNMYMSHTIRMIDVLYLYLPRCNLLLAHSTCLGSTINHRNIMYDASSSSHLTLNRFMTLRTPEITSLKPNFCLHDFPDKISIERGERERQYLKFHANDEILWSVMTWIPHPKESSDMSTKNVTIDLNGTHKKSGTLYKIVISERFSVYFCYR